MKATGWSERVTVGAITALCLGFGISAWADVPTTVVYRALLTYDTGAPFTGLVDVQVALHADPDPSTLVNGVAWGPVLFSDLDVVDGDLTIELGGAVGPPMSAQTLTQGPYWLVLWIDGTLMQPFQSISSVPYAHVAQTALSLGGIPPANFLQTTDIGPIQQQLSALEARVDDLESQLALANECCDYVLPAGICLPSTPNGATCEDQDACTAGDACLNGQCVGSPISCDDGNPCTADGCDPASGCTHSPQSASCTDEDPCTVDACQGGSCVSTPMDCSDNLSCTTDSCSGGTCSHSPSGNTCLIGGICYNAGAQNPSNTCETCNPTISTSAWTGAACSGIDNLPFQGAGFDVSNDGAVTVAGWNGSAGEMQAHCYDPAGNLVGSTSLTPLVPGGSNSTRTYVARADVTGQSVVVVFPWPGGNPPTALSVWWLTPSCGVASGPTQLPALAQELTGGSLEYFDVVMGDNGQTAIVYQSRVNGGNSGTIRPTLALFNGQGGVVSAPQIYGATVCNESGNGIRVAMRETTGDVVVTCQGHAWVPVRAQRFSANGTPMDPSMVQVSIGGGSSWYDSHIVGMQDDGSFVVAWEDSSAQTYRGAFFNSNGQHITTVDLGSASGSWFDGFRNVHARIQPISDGSYLIPGPYRYTNLDWFGRYTKNGGLVSSRTLASPPPLLRVDAANAIYALLGNSIVKNQNPYSF